MPLVGKILAGFSRLCGCSSSVKLGHEKCKRGDVEGTVASSRSASTVGAASNSAAYKSRHPFAVQSKQSSEATVLEQLSLEDNSSNEISALRRRAENRAAYAKIRRMNQGVEYVEECVCDLGRRIVISSTISA